MLVRSAGTHRGTEQAGRGSVHLTPKALENSLCASKRVNVAWLKYLSILTPLKIILENSTKIKLGFFEIPSKFN